MKVGGPNIEVAPDKPVHQTRHRRTDLQGMRAIAVLAVFADHLFAWPSGGFVGVDVFFVLSGFFITGLLIRERTTNRRLSFQNFYIRRVKRILPSAVLVLIVTVIGSYLLFTAVRAKDTLVDALYAALFVANFHFEAIGADYFQQGQPPSPLQHYWSLSIEEQFYFAWPAVLVLIFTLTRGLRRRGKSWARQWALFGAMALIVAASFGWAMFLSADDPNSAYFSTFTRVWELGVGALVAIAGPWLASIPSAIRPGLAYAGLAGVVGSLFVIDSTVQFPAPWAALPVLSTALVIASFHDAEVRGMFVLTNPVARYFGDTSYTLYLWHWPVIILLTSVMPKGPLFLGVALTLALGLTAVTYHFYENPIRKSDWLLDKSAPKSRRMPTLSPPRWGLVGGLMAMVIVVSIAGIHHSEKISAATELAAAQGDQKSRLDFSQEADPCFGAPAMVTPGCALRNPAVHLRPNIDNFSHDTGGVFNDCFVELGQESRRPCELGYKGSDAKRIAFVGDSHAAALVPALRPILEANKWRLIEYLGSNCYLAIPSPGGCEERLTEVEADLIEHPADLVLITNIPTSGVKPADYQRAWDPIRAAGNRIAVVADNPTTTEEAIACLTRVSFSGDHTGECGTPRGEAFPQTDSLVEAAQLVPGTTVIDLARFYCTADRCPSVIGNVIVYRDLKDEVNSHVTATFAETLAPALEEGIRRALSAPATP